jgi:hypothetical protein
MRNRFDAENWRDFEEIVYKKKHPKGRHTFFVVEMTTENEKKLPDITTT